MLFDASFIQIKKATKVLKEFASHPILKYLQTVLEQNIYGISQETGSWFVLCCGLLVVEQWFH